MGIRSRLLNRAGEREKRRGIETSPSAPNEAKLRVRRAARILVVAAGLAVVLAGSVAMYNVQAADPTGEKSGALRGQEQEIEELIRRYFRTWSSQDIKGYGDCFLSNSCVQFIDSQGRIELHGRNAFLESQHAFFQSSPNGATEVPESIDIHIESKLARVVVYWKLTAGSREVYGYDHFTLQKRNQKWGIVNLVFYETKRSG